MSLADDIKRQISAPLLAPHWEGLARGELLIQRCAACGNAQWPPNSRCTSCQSDGIDWIQASGQGTVWSFIRYEKALHPAYKDWVPYVVAVVALEEGVHYLGRVLSAGELAIGDSLHVEFAQTMGDIPVATFKPRHE